MLCCVYTFKTSDENSYKTREGVKGTEIRTRNKTKIWGKKYWGSGKDLIMPILSKPEGTAYKVMKEQV